MEDDGIPGEIRYGGGTILLNSSRKAIVLGVTNTGDRPIQVFLLICHSVFVAFPCFSVFLFSNIML